MTTTKSGPVWLAVIASACWIGFLSDTAHAQPDQPFTTELAQAMQRIRSANSSVAQTEAAEHIAWLTRQMDPQKINDETIGELVSLLDRNEDSVRAWIAASLGNLGPRARVAVPKLRKLLPEADCLPGELTSAPFIRLALERMMETPPPVRCEVCFEEWWHPLQWVRNRPFPGPALHIERLGHEDDLVLPERTGLTRIVPPPELIQPHTIKIAYLGTSHWKQRTCHVAHRDSNGSLQVH
jgi:hypothetical protein